jgi:polar amino acid transport system substrate-binding protein
MIRPILLAAMAAAIASCAAPGPPPVAPALRAQMAPSGTLVAGINYGNPVVAQRDPAGGDPRGVGAELARELARRLGVPIRYVTYEIAGKLADGMKPDGWDVAFLAVDPQRAQEIDFTAPYVLIEGTYLVRADSPLRRVEDFDRKGLTIAVGEKSGYDLFLTRSLKQSELHRFPTSQVAVDMFIARDLGAAAGVKNLLVTNAARHPGLRVIDGSFMVIAQAAGVPRGRDLAARYLREFIEEAKASGFVAESLRRSGISDATVAPAAQ